MPPQMPDYRMKARRRMKRGLLPEVVKAAEGSGSTGQLMTNTTGNARSGQQYREVVENGHRVHVYADGTRIGLADRPNPHEQGQGGFRRAPHPSLTSTDLTQGQGGLRRPPRTGPGYAPGSGQGRLVPLPQRTGGTIAPPGAFGPGSGGIKHRPEGTGQRDEAALQALAKQRQMALQQQAAQKLGQARVPRQPAPGAQARIVAQLKAAGFNPRRRNRRRLTGGMLAP